MKCDEPKRKSKPRHDAWPQTIALLSKPSLGDGSRTASRNRPQRLRRRLPWTFGSCAGAEAKVCVLDRPTSRTAIVSWFDSTACHYGHQLWRTSRARQPGTCALSGNSICCGDAVYRPRAVHPYPLNANAMILASWLEYANAELSYLSTSASPPG